VVRLAHPRQRNLRANWWKVLRDPAAFSAAIVLALFALVTVADSVHFRRALRRRGAPAQTFYATSHRELLDLMLARQVAMRETGYSAPLAYLGLTKEPLEVDGKPRDFPRLQFGGAHLADPATQWAGDVALRALGGAAAARRRGADRAPAAAGRAHGGWRRRCATSRPTAPTCRCALRC
jgi:peptide/nickel transport system permease protein